MKKNKGKAAAIRAGARYFFNRHDVDYIGYIDSNLSTDFNDFKKLVQTIDGNKDLSVICGSKGLGNVKIGRNTFKNSLSKIITFAFLGFAVPDSQSSAQVFRRKAIPAVYNKEFTSKLLFGLEIFLRIKKYFGSDKIMILDIANYKVT